MDNILKLCQHKKVPVRAVKKDWFNTLGVSDHQGVALEASAYPYGAVDEMLALAEQRNEPPLLLLLDTLQDPQNLGGLLRTAEAVGVHGVCLPLRHTATVTPAVVKRSSGASEHMLVAQANLAQTIVTLKEEGLWIIGLEKSPTALRLDQARLDGPLAVVVGSEGSGMRDLVRKGCDVLVQVPMRGQVSSLNASIAGSVVLYKVWEKRGF
jgi:23S rRNA (guanosine2251-2'-O)-methyltransferase